MTSQSDVVLNTPKFQASSVPDGAVQFTEQVAKAMNSLPKWYHPEMGAAKYRALRGTGQSAFPAPVLLDCAQPLSIPSRDSGRSIPCRVIRPEGTPTGVYMYFHGGGWVLGDEESDDPYLKTHVDRTGMVTITVGYRLAPEHPFPAGPMDCYDAAEWLVDNAEKEFGAPLTFIGGVSAGGHLTALTALHLLSHSNPTYANFRLKGLLLHCGCYDLSMTPSVFTVTSDPLLSVEAVQQFRRAFIPDPNVDLKDPSISPLYFNFSALTSPLPPALFLCGTADLLIDDTIFMSAKWQTAGGEAVVKIFPGAPHGCSSFPPESGCPGTAEAMEEVVKFVKEKS